MSNIPVPYSSHRIYFGTYLGALEALMMVLEDARKTEHVYSFTGLSPGRILKNGLILQGDVVDILRRVESISGSRSETT